jgi:hypothetical protein
MRCLVDLDGVLVNFISGWEKLHGITLNKPWPVGIYDMPTVYDFPIERFWDGMTEQFWVDLPFMPDGREILAIIESCFDKKDICLISRTPYYVGFHSKGAGGKIGWIEKNLPEYLDNFLLGPAKHFLATPNSILIDDWDKNIDAFNVGGGRGILYPRIWNSNYSLVASGLPYLHQRLRP